jgi:trans-aconitate methyltransferase
VAFVHAPLYAVATTPDFDAKYVGVDCVEALVQANRRQYPGVRFETGKADELEIQADLVLMKDLLQHLSADKRLRILRQLRDSGSRLLLINYEAHWRENSHALLAPAPWWVEHNLELAPFSMRPLAVYPTDGDDKHYGLFALKDVAL